MMAKASTTKIILFSIAVLFAAIPLTFIAANTAYDLDELDHLQLAWHIDHLAWTYGSEYADVERTPLFPGFLSMMVALFGDAGLLRFRVLFICFSAVAVGCMCWLVQRMQGQGIRRFDLLWVVLLVTSPPFLSKAFETRYEPLQLILFVFGVMLGVLWLEENKPRRAVMMGVALTLIFLLKVTALPFAALPPLVVMLNSKRKWRFASLFLAGALVTTAVTMWPVFRFWWPYLSTLIPNGDFTIQMYSDSAPVGASLINQWPYWLTVSAAAFAVLIGSRRKISPIFWMLVIPGFAGIVLNGWRETFYMQDLLLPALALTPMIVIAAQNLPVKRSILYAIVLALIFGVAAWDVFYISNERRDWHWPTQSNSFIVYQNLATCGPPDDLRLRDIRRCFAASYKFDRFLTGRLDRNAQASLNAFLRTESDPTDLTASSTMANVFSHQSPGWYSSKAGLITMNPSTLLQVAGLFTMIQHEEVRRVIWGGSFRWRKDRAVFDFHTDLIRNPPKLLVVDYFLLEWLPLDERAADFLNENYRVLLHFPSRTFVLVHETLGRKLLAEWDATRLLNDPADRLMIKAIEDEEQALLIAGRALELDPDHPEAHFFIGRHLMTTGNRSEAAQHFVKAAENSGYVDADAMRLALVCGFLDRDTREKLSDRMERLIKLVDQEEMVIFTRSPTKVNLRNRHR